MSVAKNSFVLTFEKPSFKRTVSYCLELGTDGVAYLFESEDGYGYVLYNSDGSRASFCGNASLCVARYLLDCGLQKDAEFFLRTDSGKRRVAVETFGENIRVTLAMPLPGEYDVCGYDKKRGRLVFKVGEKRNELSARLIDVGNRHIVIFGVKTNAYEDVLSAIEKSCLFPDGVNAEFVSTCENGLRVRVYERGCGRTAACGSGAVAVAFAARTEGIIRNGTTVLFDGGNEHVEILQNEILLSAFPVYEKKGASDED